MNADDVLAERKQRRKFGAQAAPVQDVRTVLMPTRGDLEAACATCFAEPGEPCVSMTSGRPLKRSKRLGGTMYVHAPRRAPRVQVPKFEANSNKLTPAGKQVENWLGNPFGYHRSGVDVRNPMDAWRYDPPKENILPEGGAYVTFLGSPHGVEGAFKKLRPGHTYFARPAAHTRGGYDEHGQYVVGFTTEHGLVNLMPYEYAVLDPMHLFHLVQDGHLEFTAKQLSTDDFGWKFFYCQTRGLSYAEAAIMCLGDIRQDVGWFAPKAKMSETWWRAQASGLPPHVKEELLTRVLGSEHERKPTGNGNEGGRAE